jgi:hypothetical protein
MVVLEGRQPIINIPQHCTWHLKGNLEHRRFSLQECRKRVSRYEGIPGKDEPHKLH